MTAESPETTPPGTDDERETPARPAPPSKVSREREARRKARMAESAGKPGRRNQELDFVPGQEPWRRR